MPWIIQAWDLGAVDFLGKTLRTPLARTHKGLRFSMCFKQVSCICEQVLASEATLFSM